MHPIQMINVALLLLYALNPYFFQSLSCKERGDKAESLGLCIFPGLLKTLLFHFISKVF